jgi:iodotyrosine deiodinase
VEEPETTDEVEEPEAGDEVESHLSRDLEHVPFEYRRPTMEELERRSLEFYKMASARRTVRYFSSEPVPREVIRNLVRAAGKLGSSEDV